MTARATPPPPPPPSPEVHQHRSPRIPRGGGVTEQRSRWLFLSLVVVALGGAAAAAWVLHFRPWEIPVPGSSSNSSSSSVGSGSKGGGGGGGGGQGEALPDKHQQQRQQPQQQQQRKQKQQQHQQHQQLLFSFDAPDGPSAPGVGHGHDHHEQQQFQQRERRPSCADTPSDDPEYSCLLSRPPGSFKDEIMVYLSLARSTEDNNSRQHQHQHQQAHDQREREEYKREEYECQECGEEQQPPLLLSVKIVVPAAATAARQGKGGGDGWASLGLSPNGRMAGPSEAVVGFVGDAPEESVQGPAAGVLRYRMDGYSISSVTPLPARQQILTDHAVEVSSNGSLVVRFKRPLLEPSAPSRGRDACATTLEVVGGTAGAVMEGGEGLAAVSAAEATTMAEVCTEGPGDVSDGMGWLDPRQEGVVLLWAYGRGDWPSYHDATGAFVLPHLTLEG